MGEISKNTHTKDQGWRTVVCLCLLLLGLAFGACGGGPGSGAGPGTLSLSLSSSMALAPQDGTPAKVTATISGNSGAVTLSVSGLPTGAVSNVAQQTGDSSGTITLTSSANTPAGTYSLKVTATDGAGSSASQNLTLVVAVAGMVGATVDQMHGVNGKLQQFISTSFQPAEWDYQFFQLHAPSEPAQLNALGPQHIRLQAVSQAIPMKANSNPQQASDWDFSKLDAVVQPVLSVTDHSPEFQIAFAPSFMNDPTTGQFIFNAANVQAFAAYSANLVKYYNKGGFTWGGTAFVSPGYPQHPITWWGIYNEYNINGMTPSQYIQLYNTVVPAMLSVDNSIKISAMELAVTDPTIDLPPFVAPPANGGVNAQVNVVSTHFYPTCNQQDLDTTVFDRVPLMVQYISYVYQELATRTDLKGVPVWVTENNVNADFPNSNGTSNCNPAQKFVSDPRGTSAFFAAWRPFVFSQLGKAGNQALYHWDYDADRQSGEVDYNSGSKYLSYWVDYWLGKMYPQSPAAPDILSLNITETSTVETLATKNSDGSVLFMVADRAVLSPSDNNGTGDARTVILDISSLGAFTSASQLSINAASDVTNGPQPSPITLAPKLTVILPGYGVSFLLLKP